jgi:hypothetical protein
VVVGSEVRMVVMMVMVMVMMVMMEMVMMMMMMMVKSAATYISNQGRGHISQEGGERYVHKRAARRARGERGWGGVKEERSICSVYRLKMQERNLNHLILSFMHTACCS